MTRNQLEYANLLENRRSNMRSEELTSQRDAETARHNVAMLGETTRHNKATEALGLDQLKETQRANLAREVETNRSNLANEAEVHRSNVAREEIQTRQAAETERANQAREAYERQRVDETATHNRATEAQAVQDLLERARAAMAQESEINRANLAREAENLRAALAAEEELIRSHQAQEKIEKAKNTMNAAANALSSLLRGMELRETSRSNQAREAETTRHNLAWEAIQASRKPPEIGTPTVNVSVPVTSNSSSSYTPYTNQTSVYAPTNSTSVQVSTDKGTNSGSKNHFPHIGDLFGILPKVNNAVSQLNKTKGGK